MVQDGTMSAEDLENYETDMELQLYREYRDVVGLFGSRASRVGGFAVDVHVDAPEGCMAGEFA